jgi:hypothetical protein
MSRGIMLNSMNSRLIYTIAEISNERPPLSIVRNSSGETPGNILKLKRKKPILHKEKRSIISKILYTRTTKIFLEISQFFISEIKRQADNIIGLAF